MKKLLTALALALATVTAQAQDNTKDKREACVGLSKLAGSIMGARQDGMTLSRALEIAANSESPELGKIANRIVMEAYKAPGYHTETHRKRQTTEFENKWLMACLEAD